MQPLYNGTIQDSSKNYHKQAFSNQKAQGEVELGYYCTDLPALQEVILVRIVD